MAGKIRSSIFDFPFAELASGDEPCPYRPGLQATFRCFYASQVPAAFYRQLLDMRFRRSGQLFYFPSCRTCSQCIPLRVVVDEFCPSRSQRRCWKRNQDLTMEVGEPRLTAEKFSLYCRYVQNKHGDSTEKYMGAVEDFLYTPVVPTIEFVYRDDCGKLLAVGICDVFTDAISSVYCYYDPEEKHRGLGTYCVLKELEYARAKKLAYYYLGYYVRDCPAMCYKAGFRPHQLLTSDSSWIRKSNRGCLDDSSCE